MAKGMALDRSSAIPLHRQLETALRNSILAGDLKPGDKILASRELQTHLGLSRNTIVTALSQLQSEGYLLTVRGSGTYVADLLEGKTGRSSDDSCDEVTHNAGAQAFLEAAPWAANLQGNLPFRPGIPALDLFPSVAFRRSFSAIAWSDVTDYPQPFGDSRLRDVIAKRLQQTRGISCGADQVAIVGGAQAALALIARLILSTGDRAVVEDPGYPNVRAVFAAERARIVPVPVDEAGLDVRALAKQRAVRIAHVTPSHQYPTGAVLPLERRLLLLEWAAKFDAWIIEDDYDSEFNYTGRIQPALHSLDGGQRTFYVGTFSKTLAPGLRLGFTIVPRSALRLFQSALAVTGATPSIAMQRAMAVFIERGHLSRHITKLRKVYDERRRFLSAYLAEHLECRIEDYAAGLHFVAHLPGSVSDVQFSARAAKSGLIAPPLSSFFGRKATQNGLVLGYAAAAPAVAKAAVDRLVRLV